MGELGFRAFPPGGLNQHFFTHRAPVLTKNPLRAKVLLGFRHLGGPRQFFLKGKPGFSPGTFLGWHRFLLGGVPWGNGWPVRGFNLDLRVPPWVWTGSEPRKNKAGFLEKARNQGFNQRPYVALYFGKTFGLPTFYLGEGIWGNTGPG